MTEFEVRREKKKALTGPALAERMKESFGTVEERGGKLTSSFGALKHITVSTDGKTLSVATEMDRGADNDTAVKTITAYNGFLEAATGYNAGERAKRLQKKAKEGKI